jgi:hypothetical protein
MFFILFFSDKLLFGPEFLQTVKDFKLVKNNFDTCFKVFKENKAELFPQKIKGF